jgi:hypothetical protein
LPIKLKVKKFPSKKIKGKKDDKIEGQTERKKTAFYASSDALF